MQHVKTLFTVAVFFLASCAPTYKIEKTNTSPKLRMDISTTVNSAYLCVENKKYSAMPLNEGTPIYLKADIPVTVQLGMVFTTGSSMVTVKNSCFSNFTFTPSENSEYELKFNYEYDFEAKRPEFEKGCSVEMKQRNGSELKAVISEVADEKPCVF